MSVSATHDARQAATAASAAEPPAARISAPASAVAGCPAATPGPSIVRYPTGRPCPGRARALPARRRGPGRHRQRRLNGPHQGSEAGDHRQARPHRRGHRLAGGADGDAHDADQPADGASPHPPQGPLLAARAPEARRPAAAVPELSPAGESRGLSRAHQGARPAPLAPTPTRGGDLGEPRSTTGTGLTPTSTPRHKQSGGKGMNPAGEPTTVSVTVGGKEITFETGKFAKQADGAVVMRSGETMVLATAQGRTEAREGADFFPLTIDVEERAYAAGKIPGGFFKREGRATERATQTARMIDRPIRPLWPKGFKNEVQVICTVLSADMVTGHDILCINGASAALMISALPFLGPIGAVRIGRIDGQLVVNPTLQEANEEASMDLIVVGTKDGLTMVEAGADEVPESVLLEALDIAHAEIRKLCEAQEELREKAGKPKWLDPELTSELESSHGDAIRQRIQQHGLREAGAVVEELLDQLAPPLSMESTDEDITKQLQARSSLAILLERSRHAAVEGPVREQFGDDLRALTEAEQDSKELKSAKRQLLFERIIETVGLPFPVGPATVDGEAPVVKDTQTKQFVKRAAEAIYKDLVRKKIAVEKRRPDGRGTEEIRAIDCEVSVSPRTHGSALFTRGQTQIMTLLTLGTAKEGQRIDDLSLESERRYMHHYNFPPYSVGETGFMRGPKRRDIGHGALAH